MSDKILNITDDSFDEKVLNSDVPVLVDFWAPWCGPCLAIAPHLEEIAEEYGDKVRIAKMDVDNNVNVPANFGVRSIPYLVAFKDGKQVKSLTGSHPKAAIKELIDSTL